MTRPKTKVSRPRFYNKKGKMCVQTPCQMGVCHAVHKHTCAHWPTLHSASLLKAQGVVQSKKPWRLQASAFISEEHGSCFCGSRSEAQPTLEGVGLRKTYPLGLPSGNACSVAIVSSHTPIHSPQILLLSLCVCPNAVSCVPPGWWPGLCSCVGLKSMEFIKKRLYFA